MLDSRTMMTSPAHVQDPDLTFDGRLIAAVQNRPPLWNPSAYETRHRKTFRTLWLEVGEECGADDKFCRNKWKSLRTYFIHQYRELQRLKETAPPGMVPVSKWPFYNKLSFLQDHVNEIIGNAERDPADCSPGRSYESEPSGIKQEGFAGYAEPLARISEDRQSDITVSGAMTLASTFPSVPDQYESQNHSAFTNYLNGNGKRRHSGSLHPTEEWLEIERRKLAMLEKSAREEENPEMQFFKSLLPVMNEFSALQRIRIRTAISTIVLNEYEKSAGNNDQPGRQSHQWPANGHSESISPHFNPSPTSTILPETAVPAPYGHADQKGFIDTQK